MITYPDVSHYQGGLKVTGAKALFAKATQGTSYRDPYYSNFKAQAAQLKIPFSAYHWLDTANAEDQAKWCFSVVGTTPLMIDDEQNIINVAHTLAFVKAYRALGGIVTTEYAPKWVWERSGKPNLKPLADAGLSIISSNYSDPISSGAGFAPYGGITPTIWQYTSTQLFNGYKCDFNAYKGTVEQLNMLIHGVAELAPEYKGDGDMMRYQFNANIPGNPDPRQVYLTDGRQYSLVAKSFNVDKIMDDASGCKIRQVTKLDMPDGWNYAKLFGALCGTLWVPPTAGAVTAHVHEVNAMTGSVIAGDVSSS